MSTWSRRERINPNQCFFKIYFAFVKMLLMVTEGSVTLCNILVLSRTLWDLKDKIKDENHPSDTSENLDNSLLLTVLC